MPILVKKFNDRLTTTVVGVIEKRRARFMAVDTVVYGSCASSARTADGSACMEAGTVVSKVAAQHRRTVAITSVILLALSLLAVMMYVTEAHYSTELITAPPKSEKKVVHAAEDATESFASADVTTAALKAQRAAKAQYEKMIATALKSEAKAHQEGEKATQQALMQDNLIERRKMATRLARARRDREVQSEEDAKMSRAISTEVQRTLISRVENGV